MNCQTFMTLFHYRLSRAFVFFSRGMFIAFQLDGIIKITWCYVTFFCIIYSFSRRDDNDDDFVQSHTLALFLYVNMISINFHNYIIGLYQETTEKIINLFPRKSFLRSPDPTLIKWANNKRCHKLLNFRSRFNKEMCWGVGGLKHPDTMDSFVFVFLPPVAHGLRDFP